MTTVKMGVLETITITVDREAKNVPRNMRTVEGSTSSITYMSLEKRFIMRPKGVVSKNDWGV